MKKIRTILIGLGNVNLGLLKMLLAKRSSILERYELAFTIVGVADSTGFAARAEGFSYEQLIELRTAKKKVSELKEYLATNVEDIANCVPADLLIEASAGNLQTGNPGLTIVRNALSKGMSVVLANKLPLVFAFDELHRIAASTGAGLAFSATVCGGLPVINVLRRDLKLATLKRLRGIFNATTNFILHEIEGGGSRADAIREAQRVGAAEADPSIDVNGHDTANKLLIIMKSFAQFTGGIADIAVQGIQNIDRREVEEAQKNGDKLKLLATAEKIDGAWSLSVKPVPVPRDSFLGMCDQWEMGIQIETDLYENLCMKLFEAEPVTTIAAVLRDAIDVCITPPSCRV